MTVQLEISEALEALREIAEGGCHCEGDHHPKELCGECIARDALRDLTSRPLSTRLALLEASLQRAAEAHFGQIEGVKVEAEISGTVRTRGPASSASEVYEAEATFESFGELLVGFHFRALTERTGEPTP